ncbi:hypothetical protein CYMTET_48754 [Cymbomonas tetramitiformis]|uniref:EGF-like domain-containing protein n=1 Tax=Cymbomonas tetramitiformis TaxID=36881 RepID=A0AAE0BRQ9_9CHLO|nr:hypothetical protein CYMTET_48754 [Cymbomonas tetramitiformis]
MSLDCELNGVCVSGWSGAWCSCYHGWRGSHCEILDLLPASAHSGYRRVSTASGQRVSSWGGSVLFDERRRLWTLFVSEMTNFCGIASWKTNSRIVRATSQSPEGPYSLEDEVVGVFSHNPAVVKLPHSVYTGGGSRGHGGYVLYFVQDSSAINLERQTCYNGTSEGIAMAHTAHGKVPEALPVGAHRLHHRKDPLSSQALREEARAAVEATRKSLVDMLGQVRENRATATAQSVVSAKKAAARAGRTAELAAGAAQNASQAAESTSTTVAAMDATVDWDAAVHASVVAEHASGASEVARAEARVAARAAAAAERNALNAAKAAAQLDTYGASSAATAGWAEVRHTAEATAAATEMASTAAEALKAATTDATVTGQLAAARAKLANRTADGIAWPFNQTGVAKTNPSSQTATVAAISNLTAGVEAISNQTLGGTAHPSNGTIAADASNRTSQGANEEQEMDEQEEMEAEWEEQEDPIKKLIRARIAPPPMTKFTEGFDSALGIAQELGVHVGYLLPPPASPASPPLPDQQQAEAELRQIEEQVRAEATLFSQMTAAPTLPGQTDLDRVNAEVEAETAILYATKVPPSPPSPPSPPPNPPPRKTTKDHHDHSKKLKEKEREKEVREEKEKETAAATSSPKSREAKNELPLASVERRAKRQKGGLSNAGLAGPHEARSDAQPDRRAKRRGGRQLLEQHALGTYVAHAESLEDDFHGVNSWRLKSASHGRRNLSPYVYPNGSVMLVWSDVQGGEVAKKGSKKPRKAKPQPRMSVMLAGDVDSFHDAQHFRRRKLWTRPPPGLEDPFVYRSPYDGSFHAILHGRDSRAHEPAQAWVGRHAFSEDGHQWHVSPRAAYSCHVQFNDGESTTFLRREQPHLIFDKKGRISHLVTAVVPPNDADYSFTLIQPAGSPLLES